jgi:hypothetical protein
MNKIRKRKMTREKSMKQRVVLKLVRVGGEAQMV